MIPGPVPYPVERPDGRYMVLRPPLAQRLLGMMVLAALFVFSLLVGRRSGDPLPLEIALPACALFGLSAWRVAALRVELGPTVRITNFFRTLVLTWDEIAVFQRDDRGARVVLLDGRRPRISVFGTGRGSTGFLQADDAVRQMENRRKSRLTGRRSAS